MASRVGPYSFGVELEHDGTSIRAAERAMRSVNLEDWSIEDEHCGVEVVSPVLRGNDGFVQLEIACSVLSAIGGRVTQSCGTHVHIGAESLEPSDIVRLVRFYNRNYSIIDQLHPRSRRGNRTYTNPHSETELVEIERIANNGALPIDMSFAQNGRYRAVNLAALRKHGTIEFRQHAGTLDARKLSAWIRFLFALCDCARFSEARETFGNVTDLLAHSESFGLPSEDATYLAGRAVELAH